MSIVNRTRLRYRAFVGKVSYKSTKIATGAISVSYVTPVSATKVLSSIHDVVGNKSGQNAVSHVTVDWSDATYAPPEETPTSDRTIRVKYSNSSLISTWGTPPLPSIPSVDFTSCINQLLRDAEGAMPLSANMVVNAIEAASLKTLVPSLLQGFRSIAKNKLGRKSAKDLAGSHLAYSFGLAPLISDFRSFLDVRGAVNKRMKELLRRNGQTSRISVRGSPVSGTSVTTYRPYVGTGGTHTSVTDWDYLCIPAVSAEITSFFIGANSEAWKLYSSALGLSSPLTSVWELVPFSFVIDWFVPIGDAFMRVEDKIGMHRTVTSLGITNWTHSISYKSRGVSKVTVTDSIYPKWNNFEYLGVGCNYTSYERGCGIPYSKLITAPSAWSLQRSALSISLLAQKLL